MSSARSSGTHRAKKGKKASKTSGLAGTAAGKTAARARKGTARKASNRAMAGQPGLVSARGLVSQRQQGLHGHRHHKLERPDRRAPGPQGTKCARWCMASRTSGAAPRGARAGSGRLAALHRLAGRPDDLDGPGTEVGKVFAAAARRAQAHLAIPPGPLRSARRRTDTLAPRSRLQAVSAWTCGCGRWVRTAGSRRCAPPGPTGRRCRRLSSAASICATAAGSDARHLAIRRRSRCPPCTDRGLPGTTSGSGLMGPAVASRGGCSGNAGTTCPAESQPGAPRRGTTVRPDRSARPLPAATT